MKKWHQPEIEPLRGLPSDADDERLVGARRPGGGVQGRTAADRPRRVLFGPVLIVGYCFVVGGIEGWRGRSSSYYNSDLRDVFVGMLFALVLMFTTYHFRPIVWPGAPDAGVGRSRSQRSASGWTTGSPTSQAWPRCSSRLVPRTPTRRAARSAAARCGTPSSARRCSGRSWLFVGGRFRESAGHHPTPQKRKRNRVYLGCAVVMVVGLALFGLGGRLGLPSEVGLIGEVTALWAFVVSWLLKSEYLPFLRDRSEGENPFNPPAEDGKVQTTQRGRRSTVRDGPVKSVGMWLAGTVDRAGLGPVARVPGDAHAARDPHAATA